jgi:opacity protein-like surface antigen
MSGRAAAIAVLLAITLPQPAAAQAHAHARQPDTGSLAIGGDFGAFIPSEGALSSGVALEGHVDFYVTPRVSVRFDVDWTDPPFDRDGGDSLRQVRFGGDAIYDWEGGKWHPFAGAGIAAHLVQQIDSGNDFGDSETKVGGDVLGGVEYFFNRTAAVKVEGRYQFVDRTRLGVDPSGMLLLVGLKQYFR